MPVTAQGRRHQQRPENSGANYAKKESTALTMKKMDKIASPRERAPIRPATAESVALMEAVVVAQILQSVGSARCFRTVSIRKWEVLNQTASRREVVQMQDVPTGEHVKGTVLVVAHRVRHKWQIRMT